MEKACSEPEGLNGRLGLKLKMYIQHVLENDSDTVLLLEDIAKRGSEFCDELSSRGTTDQRKSRRHESGADWRIKDKAALIVAGQKEAKEAAKDLKKWLRNCEKLTICDPYILHFSVPGRGKVTVFQSIDEYVDFVSDLVPASARHLKLFGCGYTKKIKTALLKKLKKGRAMDFCNTKLVHDRYLIKDNIDGRMIGTSFGGFGYRIFTILPLPREDTQKLLRFLTIIERDGTPPELVT
jgi:hypothetical protein